MSAATSLAFVLALTALATIVEAFVPLRAQARNANGRLATNLSLIVLTLTLGLVLNAALALGAAAVAANGGGLLARADLHPALALLVAIVVLDFATYLAHVVMHKVPALWRVHLVHHIDTAVDATTTYRQHPIEGLLRFAFLATAGWSLGATPEAIAFYRVLSAVNAILEHANIGVPARLDRAISLVWVTPNMHKIHHSRVARETDSNYANLFAFFDRLFLTFTPALSGRTVTYGIDGFDAPEHQTLRHALTLPFRGPRAADARATHRP